MRQNQPDSSIEKFLPNSFQSDVPQKSYPDKNELTINDFLKNSKAIRIISTKIIRITTIIQINMFLKWKHLIILPGSQFIVMITRRKITKFHINLCQSVINRKNVFLQESSMNHSKTKLYDTTSRLYHNDRYGQKHQPN